MTETNSLESVEMDISKSVEKKKWISSHSRSTHEKFNHVNAFSLKSIAIGRDEREENFLKGCRSVVEDSRHETAVCSSSKNGARRISRRRHRKDGNDSYVGRKVFVKDEHYGWLPGLVLEDRDENAIVRVEPPDPMVSILVKGARLSEIVSVEYKDYPGNSLPQQNDEPKRDIVDMMHLNEAAIFNNIRERHINMKPYTRVRDTLIAMNPFQWIDNLYSKELQKEYTNKILGAGPDGSLDDFRKTCDRLGMEPHVYEVSAIAYREIIWQKRNQTILVTGDSGAGKTETVKILLSHLASATTDSSIDILARVCRSSPVFEAFGNAKTLRNNNSSRFGKFIQMHFARQNDLSTSMVGSEVTTYLLEKTRVVSHERGERSYHIFYQLMSAERSFKAALWPFFSKKDAIDFFYLGQSGSLRCCDERDKLSWLDTVEALKLFDFAGETLCELMRAVAIVLQLGNLVFLTSEGNAKAFNDLQSNREFECLSKMMGVDAKDLIISLTTSELKTRDETIKISVSPQVSKEWCDALAKEVYSRVFNFIVQKMNDLSHVQDESGHPRRISKVSLLDIFGFESFETNRFEQLCINYANEKLQHKYMVDNFLAYNEEYRREGFEPYDFSHLDNAPLLRLLEEHNGILSILNEECSLRGEVKPQNLVSKIRRRGGLSSSLVHDKLHRSTEFGLRHFAGPVIYDAQDFVDRNRDTIPVGMVQVAARSSNKIIQALFKTSTIMACPTTRRISSHKNRFVLPKFQSQLRDLLSVLEDSDTRYIRCIKPNRDFAPCKVDYKGTLEQLRYSGLLRATEIAREGFPDKLSYDIIQSRFRCLIKKDLETSDSSDPRKEAKKILSQNVDAALYQLGKQKVYFKTGGKERLELLRLNHLGEFGTIIQSLVRRRYAMKTYDLQRGSARAIQKTWRRSAAQRTFKNQRRSASIISKFVKQGLQILRLHRKKCHAATTIQSQYRNCRNRKTFLSLVRSAVRIQRVYRAVQLRQRSATKIAEIGRSFLTKRSYIKTRASAIKVQNALSRYHYKLLQRSEAIERFNSATKLEAMVRGFLAKRSFMKKRASAIKVQTRFRYKLQQRSEAIRRFKSATKLEAMVRGFPFRKGLIHLKEETRPGPKVSDVDEILKMNSSHITEGDVESCVLTTDSHETIGIDDGLSSTDTESEDSILHTLARIYARSQVGNIKEAKRNQSVCNLPGSRFNSTESKTGIDHTIQRISIRVQRASTERGRTV